MKNDSKRATSAEFRANAAQMIIDMLKKGVAPWQKPWNPAVGLPHNPVTAMNPSNHMRGRYQGGNMLYLQVIQLIRGYDDPRWVTFNQATHMKYGTMTPLTQRELELNRSLPFAHTDRVPTWHVRKGEKGTMVEKWGTFVPKGERTEEIAEGETPRQRLYFRPYYVFNVAQIEGMPAYAPMGQTWTTDDRYALAQEVIDHMSVQVMTGDRAAYSPTLDYIIMPPRQAFHSPEGWYATLLHENAHATGHQTRLNRPTLTGGHPFGSEEYAKEELRAEIGSMLLANETGIPNDPTRHAAYVGSWIKSLENDPNEIFRAAKDANQIVDYMMSFKYELNLGQDALQRDVDDMIVPGDEPAMEAVL